VRRLSHILGGQTTASLETKRSVEGHQRAANLVVRGRINLAALDTAKELVQVLNASLAAAITTAKGRLVAHEVTTGVDGLRIVHGRMVGLLGWGMLAIVVGLAPVLVRMAKGARVSTTHMAIVIIEAGGSFGTWVGAVGGVHAIALVLGSADEDRVVGMGLDVLLEILRALEGLAAKVALVRLERHVDADVRGDVVTLDSSSPALVPLAGEVQVVGALAANMLLADVVVEDLCRSESLVAF